jgi:hypothetical protein
LLIYNNFIQFYLILTIGHIYMLTRVNTGIDLKADDKKQSEITLHIRRIYKIPSRIEEAYEYNGFKLTVTETRFTITPNWIDFYLIL